MGPTLLLSGELECPTILQEELGLPPVLYVVVLVVFLSVANMVIFYLWHFIARVVEEAAECLKKWGGTIT